MQNNPLLNHQAELDQALFLALTRNDFSSAQQILDAGANPNAIFSIQKGVFTSSINLFITRAATFGFPKSHNNTQNLACIRLMKDILKKSNLQCKTGNQQKCPLYVALQAFKITTQQQILESKCDLLRMMIIQGATIKFEPKQDQKANKQMGKWALRWFDVEGLRNYLVTKNYNYKETKVQQ